MLKRDTRPLRRLVLAAALWLPAMFFVWVYFSSVFSLPATSLARTVLESGYGHVFESTYLGFPRHLMAPDASLPALPGAPTEGATTRDDHIVVFRFAEGAMPEAMLAEKRQTGAEPLASVNSMIYGYGLAVIWGLILATPLTTRQRWLQMAVGWGVIALVQAFGVVTAALGNALQFLGAASLRAQGLNPELVAGLYQFGYLILPAVVPVVLWMLMNRRYIESLVADAEPAAVPPVPTRPDSAPARTDDVENP
jgi:hypothetical protein